LGTVINRVKVVIGLNGKTFLEEKNEIE